MTPPITAARVRELLAMHKETRLGPWREHFGDVLDGAGRYIAEGVRVDDVNARAIAAEHNAFEAICALAMEALDAREEKAGLQARFVAVASRLRDPECPHVELNLERSICMRCGCLMIDCR